MKEVTYYNHFCHMLIAYTIKLIFLEILRQKILVKSLKISHQNTGGNHWLWNDQQQHCSWLVTSTYITLNTISAHPYSGFPSQAWFMFNKWASSCFTSHFLKHKNLPIFSKAVWYWCAAFHISRQTSILLTLQSVLMTCKYWGKAGEIKACFKNTAFFSLFNRTQTQVHFSNYFL